MAQVRLRQLFRAVEDTSTILILPHNDPDPDAIASAIALRHLLQERLNVESTIVYRGIVGRAENRAMVRYRGLSRGVGPADAAAYFYLQPRVDTQALAQIEYAQVPANYFKSFDAALQAARVYDGLLFAYVGMLTYTDMAAEMADVLLRLEKAQWVICVGLYQTTLILSVRTRSQEHTAEELAQSIVAGEGTAGGHGAMAGGQISLGDRNAEQQVHLLRQRALRLLGLAPQAAGESLI